jgi:hypothetical protein
MGREVGHTAHGITLNFDVARHHLLSERLEAVHFDYKFLVGVVDGQVTERSTSGTLHLYIGVLKELKNRLKRFSIHRTDTLFGDFGKRECGAAVELKAIRMDKGRKSVYWACFEEVKFVSLA